MKTRIFLLALIAFFVIGLSDASAHPATGIVVDRAGNVYFSDLETIWKLDINRKLTVFRPAEGGRHVHELSIDQDDNIYGGDITYNAARKTWPSSVWKMTPAGTQTYLVELTENPPRALSIWRDRGGNSYWIDQNNHTKTQTLLLRRAPDGTVTTLAGSRYGHRDGKGTEAQFSSVGGMAFGPDGNLYLTDGTSVRRVSLEGDVSTVAQDLKFNTREDQPTLFGGSHGLTGLALTADGTVYVADAGNRRLLKITNGKVEVAYRAEPPFFPNGVYATRAGDVYIMEVGFALPSTSSGPRIRKLSTDGKHELLASLGTGTNSRINAAVAEQVGASAESALEFFYLGGAIRNVTLAAVAGLVAFSFIMWRRRRREHRV